MSEYDPYRAYNFSLVVQGVAQAHFTECSGPGVQIEAIEYREAGNNQTVRRFPGKVHYDNIELRFGLSESQELWDWLMASARGSHEPRNVSIVYLDSQNATEVMRWDLINAWPSQWRSAPLNALGSELAIETLVLVYESIQRS